MVWLGHLLIPRDAMKGVVCHATLLQQEPQPQMPSQVYANYILKRVLYFFSVELATNFLMFVSVAVLFSVFGSNVAAMFTNGDSTIGVCSTTDLWNIPMADICAS